MGAMDPPENQNNGIPGIDSADNDSNPDDEQNEEDGLMVAKDTNLGINIYLKLCIDYNF